VSDLLFLHYIEFLHSVLQFPYYEYYSHDKENNDNDKEGNDDPYHRARLRGRLILIICGSNLFGCFLFPKLRKHHFLVGIIEAIVLGGVVVVPFYQYFSSDYYQHILTILEPCFQIVDVLS
jgi:hypothetical protein